MAVVVLLSTMSFTMDMHYCGDTLVETAIFHKAKGCGMEMQTLSTQDCSVTKKSCCDDKQLAIEGQDELQLRIDKISFEQQLFITSFVYSYINFFQVVDKKVASFGEYQPPLVVKQIFKIDESYLI